MFVRIIQTSDIPFCGTENNDNCMMSWSQTAKSSYTPLHAVSKKISRYRKRRTGGESPKRIAAVRDVITHRVKVRSGLGLQ